MQDSVYHVYSCLSVQALLYPTHLSKGNIILNVIEAGPFHLYIRENRFKNRYPEQN